ncbi:hypothetical protein PJW08_09585 [Tenacibaculum finnmarkense]|nr:hypothetical protein PJW08_09585 [Tenacibaculum finnmarkense]
MEIITRCRYVKKVIAQNISRRDSKKEAKPFKRKWLIQCFGISKQAFYKRLKSYQIKQNNELILTQLVKQCRDRIGQKLGAKKLYHQLKIDIDKKGIKIGRDKFYNFLRSHRLLVPRTKNYHITTNSKHHFYKYKNLVSNKIPTRAEQLG